MQKSEELVQNGKQIIKQLIKEDLRGAFLDI